MGEQAPVERDAARVEPAGGGIFVRRAANAFLLFAALALLALLVAIGFGPGQADTATVLSAIAVAVVSGIGCWALSSALSRGHPMAAAIAVPVLWVVVVAGILQVVVDLTVSKLTIPIDAIVAGWALSASDRPAVRARGAGLAAAALAVVLVGPRFIGPVVAGIQRASALAQEDIRFALRSNCYGPADRSSGRVVITIDWSWATTGPFTGGEDAIELRWADSDPVVVQESLIEAPGGVTVVPWPYDVDPPPNPALAVLLQEHGDGHAVRFSLTGEAARAGGRITVPFDSSTADPATMTFVARYARGTDWRIAEVTPCDLPLAPSGP